MKSTLSFLLLLLLTVLHPLPPKSSSPSTPPPPASFPKEALPSRSGYLTVNQTTGSAMYYAFYEAQNPNNTTSLLETPLLIWLQGGPGCSSLLGNFFELGPWRVSSSQTQDVELQPNPAPWNRLFGVVFLDSPIGTGFSIAASENEIPNNQFDTATHLWIALQEFIALDPVFKTRPVYLTGESYAGKYIPSFAYYTLKRNAQLPKGEVLVKKTIVLLYQGANDLTDGVVSTKAWVKRMRWEGTGRFLEKERKVWEVNEMVAGYAQKSESLSHVVVLNAGHLVPATQPVNSQAMIEDWVQEKGLFADDQKIDK